jgi:hypothetical protein
MKTGQKAALAVGALVVVLGAAVVRDVQGIDPTSGGYSPPYDEFTGEPIDWTSQRSTEQGFRDDGGLVLDTSLGCTTGMIRGHVGPLTFDYRTLSERAIAVHRPHVACVERGFEPEWDYPAEHLAMAPARTVDG